MLSWVVVPSIAVLEPEKYGRAALKQSAKYVKGRASTFICLILLTVLVEGLVYLPALAVAQTGLPLWVKISVAISINILSSVVRAYIAIVGVVTYFVCKSSFDATLPEFQRGSKVPATKNPYEPLQVFGSTKPEMVSSTSLWSWRSMCRVFAVKYIAKLISLNIDENGIQELSKFVTFPSGWWLCLFFSDWWAMTVNFCGNW